MTESLYITFKEAADLTGCTDSTLRRHAISGHLGAMIRPGDGSPTQLLRANVLRAMREGIMGAGPLPAQLLVAEVEHLADAGEEAIAITHRLGYRSWETLSRLLWRADRGDLVTRLTARANARGYAVSGDPYQRSMDRRADYGIRS